MKPINYLFFIQLLLVGFSSCSTKEQKLIDKEKVLEAYKNIYQIKPEILSIEIDTSVDKSKIFQYYDKVILLEKEKQIKENRLKADQFNKSLKDPELDDGKKMMYQVFLKEHEEKIESVMSGGAELDSTKTIKKIVDFQKALSHDTINYHLILFTVEQRASEQSGIKYDKWIYLKSIESGSLNEMFHTFPQNISDTLFIENYYNSLVKFNPNEPYRPIQQKLEDIISPNSDLSEFEHLDKLLQ
jgi:hypothetical protein